MEARGRGSAERTRTPSILNLSQYLEPELSLYYSNHMTYSNAKAKSGGGLALESLISVRD